MAVFYAFHYREDHRRVQQIMDISGVEGQPLLSTQDWESIKSRGDAAVEDWINEEMKDKTAVIVLSGLYTASRPWVQYEIRHAWDISKPLLSIDISGLEDDNGQTDPIGPDPFTFLDNYETVCIPRYIPSGPSADFYNEIKDNLAQWASQGYVQRLFLGNQEQLRRPSDYLEATEGKDGQVYTD